MTYSCKLVAHVQLIFEHNLNMEFVLIIFEYLVLLLPPILQKMVEVKKNNKNCPTKYDWSIGFKCNVSYEVYFAFKNTWVEFTTFMEKKKKLIAYLCRVVYLCNEFVIRRKSILALSIYVGFVTYVFCMGFNNIYFFCYKKKLIRNLFVLYFLFLIFLIYVKLYLGYLLCGGGSIIFRFMWPREYYFSQ